MLPFLCLFCNCTVVEVDVYVLHVLCPTYALFIVSVGRIKDKMANQGKICISPSEMGCVLHRSPASQHCFLNVYWQCLFLQVRTEITVENRSKLVKYFDEGMKGVGSPLIKEAAAATGLDSSVVEVSESSLPKTTYTAGTNSNTITTTSHIISFFLCFCLSELDRELQKVSVAV